MIEIPEPICKVCGKPIPRKNNESISHWLRRKACWDNSECRKVAMTRTVAAWREKNPDYWKKEAEERKVGYASRDAIIGRKKFRAPEDEFDTPLLTPWVPKRKPMPAAERERLDAEQRRLDRLIDDRAWARTGMVADMGRVLTRAEIDAISHTVTHISRIPYKLNQEVIGNIHREF